MSGIAGDLFTIDTAASTKDVHAVVFTLRLRPGAGATRITGRAGSGLLVQLAAPPTSPRANESCAALLAATLGVELSQVEMLQGGGKEKLLRVKVADLDDLRRKLDAALEEAAMVNSGGKGRRTR